MQTGRSLALIRTVAASRLPAARCVATSSQAFAEDNDKRYRLWGSAGGVAAAFTAAGLGYYYYANGKKVAVCETDKSKEITAIALGTGPVERVDLGSEAEFDEAELYDVKVFGGKSSVLVTKAGGQFYCTGASCTHYSAPLVKGVLAPDHYGSGPSYHVSCPWHDAEFDLKTGACVNGPSLTAIPTYPVEVKNGRVVATLPKDMKETVEPPVAKRDPNNKAVYAVIGGGPASMAAMETLRQEGFTGRIVFITKEEFPPYDRPVLSKNLYADIDHIQLRKADFMDKLEIESKFKTTVTKLDAKNSTLHFDDGSTMKYDKMLCCAGAEPRRIPVPGHEAKNIFILRRPDHATGIQEYAMPGKKVCVVGTSFIGMEVACTLAKKGAKVALVGMEYVPFERVLGKQVGQVFKNVLDKNKLDFYGPAIVNKYDLDENGMVKGVELKDGKGYIECDAVVLGAGVAPTCHKFVEGVQVHSRDGSIICDPFMKARDGPDNFWAAGDCVTFPWYKSGHDTRIEHWDVAYQQGRVAAQNMCGKHVPFANIPFFWTMIFGKSLRYAGHCRGFDELHVEGDLDKGEFVAYYIKGDNIEAVATCNRDPIAVATAELMKLNHMPTGTEVKTGKIDADGLVKKLKEYNKKRLPAQKDSAVKN